MTQVSSLKSVLFFVLLGFSWSVQADSDSNSSIEKAILVQVNQYRVSQGLGALQMNALISKEARQHSLDMASHKIPFGHHYFSDRIKRLYSRIPNPRGGAENVAYNYKTAKIVVDGWLKSPGHKRNIVGNYNLTGIGVVRDKQGRLYYTQMFLRADTMSSNRSGSHKVMT
jgi:uncharacterized protein YkwD